MILEGGVTGGRGYNAYKRGGIPEFRERFADDIISAIFWMKGVDIFNGIFNWASKKFLKIQCFLITKFIIVIQENFPVVNAHMNF